MKFGTNYLINSPMVFYWNYLCFKKGWPVIILMQKFIHVIQLSLFNFQLECLGAQN